MSQPAWLLRLIEGTVTLRQSKLKRSKVTWRTGFENYYLDNSNEVRNLETTIHITNVETVHEHKVRVFYHQTVNFEAVARYYLNQGWLFSFSLFQY